MAAAQTGPPHNWDGAKAWTKDQGLPDNAVQAVRQTRDGYLWVATRSGLARFDGVRFSVFNRYNTAALRSDDCRALVEDATGALWIGTRSGLLCRRDHSFTNYGLSQGLPSEAVRALGLGTGPTLWIGTEAGLARYTAGRFEALGADRGLEGLDVFALHEDSTGVLWVGTSAGLHYLDPGSGRFQDDRQPPGAAGQRVTGVYEDRAGRLWVTTAVSPESYYAWLHWRQDGRWSRIPEGNANYPGWRPVGFAEQPDGTLWIPAVADHLRWRSQEEFGEFRLPSLAARSDFAWALHVDREANLWVGTDQGGLRRLRAPGVEFWSTNHGLPHPSVWTIGETRDGTRWIGTDGGLSRLGSGEVTTFAEPHGLSRNMVRALLPDAAGRLWIGTGGGLDCLEQGYLTRYRFPGEWYDSKIRALHLGPSGILWVGAARTLFGVDLSTLTPPTAAEAEPAAGPGILTNGPPITLIPTVVYNGTNGLASDDVRAVWEDRAGDLWVGTYGGGLCRQRSGRWETFTTTNGLPSDRVWAFHEDAEGRLWIGTERGLVSFHAGRFATYTEAQGLFHQTIHQILEDDAGHLWLTSPRGIARVSRRALIAVAEGRAPTAAYIVYDESDGLPTAETNGQKNQPAACKTRDGRLWFPTAKGVVVFDPQHLPDNPVPPPVVIEEVRANRQIVLGDGEMGLPGAAANAAFEARSSTWTLGPGTAHILEIRYTAPSFVASDPIQFHYRLEGLDRDWVGAGTRREAVYANLRPGRYAFRVRAVNKYGVASVGPATFAFRLEPHLHQTGWFYSLCAGGLLATALGLYRWRLGYARRIHQLEQAAALAGERARIAKDLHDGLGANLTELTLLADLAEGHAAEPHTLARHLRELSRSSRETISGLKDLLWATNAADATLEGLLTRVCEQAERFLAPTGVRCRFDLPSELPAIPLPPQTRHHLFLVAKEALNNVARHAQATEVRVLASVGDTRWTLSLADNGRGFVPPESPGRGGECRTGCHGLDTMRQRVQEMGGTLTVSSQPGQGTVVRIELLLPSVPGERVHRG